MKYAPLKFVFILSKASSSVVVGIVTIDDLVSLFRITDTRTKEYSIETVEILESTMDGDVYLSFFHK
ncbi:MAG: hypothetical protein WA220_11070 [Candidatus Nitrosopolaris sp.]